MQHLILKLVLVQVFQMRFYILMTSIYLKLKNTFKNHHVT